MFLMIRTQCRASIPPSQPPHPDVSGTSMYTARTPQYIDEPARYAI